MTSRCFALVKQGRAIVAAHSSEGAYRMRRSDNKNQFRPGSQRVFIAIEYGLLSCLTAVTILTGATLGGSRLNGVLATVTISLQNPSDSANSLLAIGQKMAALDVHGSGLRQSSGYRQVSPPFSFLPGASSSEVSSPNAPLRIAAVSVAEPDQARTSKFSIREYRKKFKRQ